MAGEEIFLTGKYKQAPMQIIIGRGVQCLGDPNTYAEFCDEVQRDTPRYQNLPSVETRELIIDCAFAEGEPGTCTPDCEHCLGANTTTVWFAYRPAKHLMVPQ